MLQLASYVMSRPVLSLRSGQAVASIQAAIINPRQLKLEGFYCQDSIEHTMLVLLTQDIRETSPQGLIIDDHDVLAPPEDIVRLKDVFDLRFQLYHKPVETVEHTQVGRVEDYAVETATMYIQKLYASQPLWRNISGGSLSVDRSQIVEVTSKKIVIQELLQPTPSTAPAVAV